MKKKILSIVLFFILSTKVAAHTEHYKDLNVLEYELFRNNNSIGFHNYKFERNKNYSSVKSRINFKIIKLGIELYRYNGTTEEKYEKNQLIKFLSNTNQNKKIKNTKIIFDKERDELIISGSENQLASPKEYLVGTWWNHEIIQAKAQISAVSGRIIEQKVTFLGKEKLNLYGKNYNALRFNLLSTDKNLPLKKKLDIDVWYEEDTNVWLKASFIKNGNWEYRLKKID
jgi:hypothetical protein